MSGEWRVYLIKEAQKDYRRLDGAVRNRVSKAILRVAENPLPVSEGGYGKPLGNQNNLELAGLLKVKLRADGIRVIYKLERVGETMHVVVIGAREDKSVYREAARRRERYGL